MSRSLFNYGNDPQLFDSEGRMTAKGREFYRELQLIGLDRTITTSDASDLATAITLVNELKEKFNAPFA